MPDRECDIVMKGGITSGVVYPLTVYELSRKFRFRNIGGTSAGALAAAITAAAEYSRKTDDFTKVRAIPDEVALALPGFFQPIPLMTPLFDALMAAQSRHGGLLKVLRVLTVGYWPWPLVGLAIGVFLAWVAWRAGWSSLCLPGVVLGFAGAVVGLGLRLVSAAKHDFPLSGFGLCTGLTMPGHDKEGLTDWLARTIDEVAGRDPAKDDPLTFDDLEGPDPDNPAIRLHMMTTNLSMRRAHRLPMRDNIYFFRKADFDRLFPSRIVDYLMKTQQQVVGPDGKALPGYYHMPKKGALPVVVGARMSLSFPGLIATVPLYTWDRTLIDKQAKAVPQRCLFSDGGLSSNFPVHFFDRLFPCTPTFAITLDSWRRAQHGDERVSLPDRAGEGIAIPVKDIASLPGFLMSLVDSAKDWQDNLQSTLPGYRERIAHVALDDSKEGGMNLDMDPDTIRTLVGYGRDAGVKLANDFDLDDHRWRRFLVAAARIEETLDEMVTAYDGAPGRPESFGAFLDRYPVTAGSYRQTDAWLAESRSRVEALMTLARGWRAKPRLRDGRIPRPASDLRITARY